MALKASICKLELSVADMDRHYYGDHSLTLAQHPSETTERLMLRVLAFALYADPALSFGGGISTDDEPDLWQRSLDDRIEHWIDLGQPEERRIKRAKGRAEKVSLICYGGPGEVWWKQQKSLSVFANIDVLHIGQSDCTALAELHDRNMHISATLQDGGIWLADSSRSIEIKPARLHDG